MRHAPVVTQFVETRGEYLGDPPNVFALLADRKSHLERVKHGVDLP
jgi:hypothetical protein